MKSRVEYLTQPASNPRQSYEHRPIYLYSSAADGASAVQETFAAISELFDLDGLEGVCLGHSLSGHLVCEVRVDVANVRFALQARNVGRSDVPFKQLVPVNGAEECVSFDLFDGKSVVGITLKQASEQVSSVWAKSGHNFDVLLRDFAQNLVA